MSKKKIQFCKVCNENTTHMHKRKCKTKKNHSDLNLRYCMKCKTDYTKQLTGRMKGKAKEV